MKGEKSLKNIKQVEQIKDFKSNIQIQQNFNQKDEIIENKKIIQKKKEELLINNNKKIEIKNILSDDDLEHPIPLDSDYYEEDKEEIKNNFYQNKLKEKKKIKENIKKEDINKKNYLLKEENKFYHENKIKKKSKISLSKNINIPNENIKYILKNNNVNKIIKNNLEKKNMKKLKINITDEKLIISAQKDNLLENKNKWNKENINNNIEIDKNNYKKIKILPVTLQKNNNKKKIVNIPSDHAISPNNIILKKQKKIQKIKIEPNLNKTSKTNETSEPSKNNQNKEQKGNTRRQINKIKSVQHPRTINLKQTLNQCKLPSDKIIKEIKHNNLNNNKIYNNTDNNILEDEKIKLIPINNQNDVHKLSQNKSQFFYNNIIFNINQKERCIPDNNIISSKSIEKSQSFCRTPLNKIIVDNSSRLNKNLSKKLFMEKIDDNKTNINNLTCSYINNINNSNINIENSQNIIFNSQNTSNNLQKNNYNNNSQLFNLNFCSIPKNNNFSYFINPKNKNIKNNIQKNSYFINNSIEVKDNILENKKIYEINGQFNNTQTYVVISNNSKSKIKLIPKINKTIDYECNNILNPVQSTIQLNSSKINLEKNNISSGLNNEQIIHHNVNNCYYSNYIQNIKYIGCEPSHQSKIKKYKSLNNFNIRSNYYNDNQNINKNNNIIITSNRNQTINSYNSNNNYSFENKDKYNMILRKN